MAQQQPMQPQNFGYPSQFPPHPGMPQNGQHQNLANGYPSTQPPQLIPPNVKPLPSQQQQQFPPQNMPLQPQQQQQQMPPLPQALNYGNFQMNAVHSGGGLNGSNSALSSRTSSPGVQPSNIPASQLPPSKSYPNYQQMQGNLQSNIAAPGPGPVQQPPPPFVNAAQQPQQPSQPSSQFPMAPPMAGKNSINNNINNNGETSNVNPMNAHLPPSTNAHAQSPLMQQVPLPQATPLAAQQQQLSASMKNLTLNSSVPNFPQQMPSSKSDQNLLNNNNNNNGNTITAYQLLRC